MLVHRIAIAVGFVALLLAQGIWNLACLSCRTIAGFGQTV